MLDEEHLSALRAGDPGAWSAIDWRVPVYVMMTSQFSSQLPIWYREITPDGVKFERPTQYDRSRMIDQFCRGYAISLQNICDQAFPGWPLEASVRDGSRGSYLMIRVTQPERTTSFDEVCEVLGQEPELWKPMADTWREWDLDIREQAALSFAIRICLAETTAEEVASWAANAPDRSHLQPVPEPDGSEAEGLDEEALQAVDGIQLNATELAKELGISVRNMQRYIAGQRGIPIEVLSKIIESRPDLDARDLIAHLAKKRGQEDGDVVLN
jgi:hypothetical protein